MLERQHLIIVREAVRQGTLTGAAERLCLTQSALSHAIKKLEASLGCALWQKDGRKLRLTRAGDYVLQVAERLLPQLEHAEVVLQQIAGGHRGTLRIGMECHPCYQWLLKVVAPFLKQWPDVDVDVKQKFQFGGIGALYGHEIDLLVTPDPLYRAGLEFAPVFDYEQVLVVAHGHRLSRHAYAKPEDLTEETLITYPVEPQRLDVFSEFLHPAHCAPKIHKRIETTDIALQMVAAGRGVMALPQWLVQEYRAKMPVVPVRLGRKGVHKRIYLGTRCGDPAVDYLEAFKRLALELQA